MFGKMKKFLPLLITFLIVFLSAAVITAGDTKKDNGEIGLAAESQGPVLGDINGDGLVDVSDAIALFQHSMLPDLFPIDYSGSLDLDKDGLVNISDALRLFQYSMLPDQFPIEWGTEEDTDAALAMEDLKSYIIVRSSFASRDLQRAANSMRNTMTINLGIQLQIKTDSSSAAVPSEYEIQIGKCNREEALEFFGDLKLSDYGYAMVGKKLVICGGSDEATVEAINAFTEAVVMKLNGESDIFFSNADAFIHRATYEIETLTLQGSDISEYTVVYPADNASAESIAEELVKQISQKTGTTLKLKSDEEPSSGREILIGSTNRLEVVPEEGTYRIGAEGDHVYACGVDGTGTYYAMCALAELLLETAESNREVVLEAVQEKEVPMDQSLKAMSFNIYYDSLTKQRKGSVKQTILNYLPDTLGVQEATKEWMSYLNSALGGVYDSVGLGRDGGSNGEHSAIFYKRDRFELIETGTKWMSETPDEVSKFEESSMNRVFTYALLREKKTNEEIMVVNTHLDHTSSAAREKQAAVLIGFLKDYTQYPIVLTGDFNTMPGSRAYRTVTELLADSSEIAEKAEIHGTYGSSVIDYAFVSEENINVSSYRVITEEANGMQPSDHYPLIIESNISK